jgi:hypothetical protein
VSNKNENAGGGAGGGGGPLQSLVWLSRFPAKY